MTARTTPNEPVLPAGVPCWVELAARDERRAQAFYAGLLGWRFTVAADPATPSGQYAIARLDGVQVAGVYQAAADQPAGWSPHLSVRDTAGTADRVRRLGGLVTLGPVDIPRRGSILHAVEPSGAPIVFWRPATNWQFGTGVPGTYTGADLNTNDGARADEFFRRLLGYGNVPIGDRTIDYAEWQLRSQAVLYRYVMGPEYPPGTPPHWLIYFEVDRGEGTDKATARAIGLGGTVVIEPYDSLWGRIAVLADPDGAPFSLIDHSDTPQTRGRAAVDDPYDD